MSYSSNHLKPDYMKCPLTIFKPDDEYMRNQDDSSDLKGAFIALVETMDDHIYRDIQPEINDSLANFIISIAEPRSRPQYIHEYKITKDTLKAATQVGYKIQRIRTILLYFHKYTKLPDDLQKVLSELENSEQIISISILSTDWFLIRCPQKIYEEFVHKNYQVAFHLDQAENIDDSLYDEYLQTEYEQTKKLLLKMQSGKVPVRVGFNRLRCPIKFISRFRKAVAEDFKTLSVVEEYFYDRNKKLPPSMEHYVADGLQKLSCTFNFESFLKQPLSSGDRISKCYRELEKFAVVAPSLQAQLKSTTVLRDYQEYSRDRVASLITVSTVGSTAKQIFKLNSGMIVLPCGSGKSLQGVATACRVGASALVVSNSNFSSQQWKDQFLLFSTIEEKRIFIFSSQQGEDIETDKSPIFIPGYHTVLIATYQMLTASTSQYAKHIKYFIKNSMWGIVLFDEAHQMVSNTFKQLYRAVEKKDKTGHNIIHDPDDSCYIRSYCKVALTATPLREDQELRAEEKFIGCKLFESNWQDLSKSGHLAQLECAVITCPITRLFYQRLDDLNNGNSFEFIAKSLDSQKSKLLKKQQPQQSKGELTDCTLNCDFSIGKEEIPSRLIGYIGIMNPEKLKICNLLKNYHIQMGHQILIFCDSIEPAHIYAKLLEIPFIDGSTPEAERKCIIDSLKARRCNCIMLSRVGDTSLDMPEVNVLIEINWQEGSQRQETQRIGRISRPKSAGLTGYFYVLVTEKTQEEKTSVKRRQYLSYNQGYSYSVLDTDEIRTICEQKHVSLDDKVKIIFETNREQDYFDELVACANYSKKQNGKR